jgi:hypothetical protein
MNDAFLPLPSWFAIETPEDASLFLNIISEHVGSYDNGKRIPGCLGSLDESHSDDVPILQVYRRWLTTSDVFDLLGFLAAFASHVMQKRARKEWAKRFSVENLTILFERGYGMTEIVQDSGFLSVAKAIRNATITALWLQQQGNKKWDVRFGLAQQWKQKMKGGANEFIPALAEFVQGYNWEVAHRLDGKYHTVSKEDLNRVMELITKDGDRSKLIGMLLLAYGYAMEAKSESDETRPAGGK